MKNIAKKHSGGQAMLIAVIFFLAISVAMVFGVAEPILKQVAVSKDNFTSKKSYFLAEGGVEDAVYRLKSGMQLLASETLSLDGGSATITTTDTADGKEVVAVANNNNKIRKMKTAIVLGEGVAIHYGVQVGNGGFILENSSMVTGNIHSSGSVTGSGNTITGDVVSSGPAGLIDDVHVYGSAFAHTVRDADVDGDAYYTVISGTSVGGTSYPGSPDQSAAPFPILDEQIEEWKTYAEAGGVATCSGGKYLVSSGSRTIGPIKIPCNLEISGTANVTLAGHVWVTGNMVFQNSAIVRISSALGNNSVAVIADDPSNRLTGSSIDLKNSSQFFGSGSPSSFVFLISQNNSAENGGSVDAIAMDNSSSGSVVLYASHGLISVNNSATLKEVTAYKIKTKNSANIIYDTGLTSTLFTSGPGGGYDILSWEEIE